VFASGQHGLPNAGAWILRKRLRSRAAIVDAGNPEPDGGFAWEGRPRRAATKK